MTSLFALWAGTLLALGGPVTELTITPMASQTSVLISIEGEVRYRDFQMEGPHRLVVDLIGATHALPQDDFAAVNRGGILSMRTSQYSEDVVRVVLVLDRPLGYSVIPDSRGLRISLENPTGDFEPWSSGSTTPYTESVELPAPSAPQVQEARRISVTWTEAPINDVLLAFAAFSGRSIVPGSNVTGFVTADINDQPWDIALETILAGQGLVAEELPSGIIRVDNITDLNDREAVEPIETRAHRVSYATAAELQAMVQPLLTERGNVSTGQGTNTLIVSDIRRVQEQIEDLLAGVDVQTPQVTIQAKIIFVNRTELDELGVTYELKDSRGNQFNQLSSGFADTDGDGTAEVVAQGTSVVALGGNSIAALGNATQRVAAPSLQLLTSLVMGRHQLIGFIDALESVQLSDIEATPQVTVLDNQLADFLVGELTPIRTIDAGAGAAGGQGGFPTAQVEQQETGIILQATPHVTPDGYILLEVLAERSAAELAESDAGFIFRTQRVETRVLVEDGETVVMGGLTQSERTESLAGIPLLKDLPIIGALFRTRRQQEIQRDLIILVTPHIVRSGLAN
ncbi:MAG: AMIN domain-containing protein [Gemmatimonadetes bacterium]|nr:AMIN domain-containing protein [Gemmatimonadota bacterium]NNF14287.1 AMIN domain-containing protein [Gemmatimonadota bacterium]NNL29655.1 AMIN domain-containing protein [Gemmatimonadota bacterium]